MFLRESTAGYLSIALTILSVILISLEANSRFLDTFRSTVSTIAYPILALAETPYLLSVGTTEILASRASLTKENKILKDRLSKAEYVTQQVNVLSRENYRLRALLGSKSRLSTEVLVSELMFVGQTPQRFEVLIDKGSDNGIREGQAVIDADGLYGQVIETSPISSRVLQLIDVRHAVPVEVVRTGIRAIAAGTGNFEYLELENLSVNADIRQGDLLVTSGLGGRFPAGYPVGMVEAVNFDRTKAYISVTVKPSAKLNQGRYVLVVFQEDD